MAPWKAIGSVLAGAVVTVVLSAVTVILLPFLGLATAEVVGNGLPSWVFAVPLALCALSGGAIAGFLQGRDTRRGAIAGGLAAALGVAVIGVIFGLVFFGLMLGFTPAHGTQEADLTDAALMLMGLGGVAGFAAGGIFGVLGGISGHVGRQELGL